MVCDEAEALRLDGLLELGDLAVSRAGSVAATAMEHGDPLPAPRAQGNECAQRAEQHEHRLMQQHGDQARAGQGEESRKHTATARATLGSLGGWPQPRREPRSARPSERRTTTLPVTVAVMLPRSVA